MHVALCPIDTGGDLDAAASVAKVGDDLRPGVVNMRGERVDQGTMTPECFRPRTEKPVRGQAFPEERTVAEKDTLVARELRLLGRRDCRQHGEPDPEKLPCGEPHMETGGDHLGDDSSWNIGPGENSTRPRPGGPLRRPLHSTRQRCGPSSTMRRVER